MSTAPIDISRFVPPYLSELVPADVRQKRADWLQENFLAVERCRDTCRLAIDTNDYATVRREATKAETLLRKRNATVKMWAERTKGAAK